MASSTGPLLKIRAEWGCCCFRRFRRFVVLSLHLVAAQSLTFARLSSKSKASDRDEPTWPVKPRKPRVERGGSQQNLADSLQAPSCLSNSANHLRSRTLALADARSVTVLKASRKRYPAGIRVTCVIVVR